MNAGGFAIGCGYWRSIGKGEVELTVWETALVCLGVEN